MSENRESVEHLLREISRAIEYLLDQGTSMYCTLPSEHYRCSPLVQGGLEIECQIVIKTQTTVLQARLTTLYLDLVKNPYWESTEDRVVRNLFNFIMMLLPTVVTPQAPVKRKKSLHPVAFQEITISEKCSQNPRKKKHQMLL